jgi:hypothetical protein
VVLGTEVMIFQGIAQDLLWTERPREDMPIQKASELVRGSVSNADAQ